MRANQHRLWFASLAYVLIAALRRIAPAEELVSKTTVEKEHGRILTRVCTASANVDWIASDRSCSGAPRFTSINTIVKILNRTDFVDRCTFDTRLNISSAALDIQRLVNEPRGHWGVESMHWLLDIVFKDDLSRYRSGHGAKNMAALPRFALGLIRAATGVAICGCGVVDL